MKRIFLLFSAFFFIVFLKAQPVQVMLITGGHAYDTIHFLQLFDALDGIEYQEFEQPIANKTIANGLAENFDVLVFYDMWQDISDQEKSAYIELTKKGIPFLFLHHSLVSYQKWKEFEKIVGGKYIEKAANIPKSDLSTYDEDVWVYAKVLRNHPATRGFSSFRFFDEVYGNIRISENITPLLSCTHPKSSEIIGWENVYNASKIIYLQPGHDARTYDSEDYRKLIQQTIKYLASTK